MIIKESDINSVLIASKFLKEGKIIAFATDTIYGIACDGTNDLAVRKLYQLKNRDDSKPIAIFVKDIKIAEEIVEFSKNSLILAENFVPGPVTLVLKKKNSSELKISKLLNKNNDFIGIRIPNHDFSLKLLENFNGVLAVTSANISNMKPANCALQVQEYFANQIDLIIDGGRSSNEASTVVKFDCNDQIEILREGIIIKNQILSKLGQL